MTTEGSGGPLSPSELDEFLAQPLLLKLACVRPDGWPYIVPLWYAWHDHKLYVVGRERAMWIGYIRREPRVGVLIDEEARRHRRIQMTATAAVVEAPCRVPRAASAGVLSSIGCSRGATWPTSTVGRMRRRPPSGRGSWSRSLRCRSHPGAAAAGIAATTSLRLHNRRPPRFLQTDPRPGVAARTATWPWWPHRGVGKHSGVGRACAAAVADRSHAR